MNQNQPIEIDVQDIDHLGLIAGIVDEIGIVEIINRLLGTHPLEEISAGHVVKALILNCLGFLTAPLYLEAPIFRRQSHGTLDWSRSKTRTSMVIVASVGSSTSSIRKD